MIEETEAVEMATITMVAEITIGIETIERATIAKGQTTMSIKTPSRNSLTKRRTKMTNSMAGAAVAKRKGTIKKMIHQKSRIRMTLHRKKLKSSQLTTMKCLLFSSKTSTSSVMITNSPSKRRWKKEMTTQ